MKKFAITLTLTVLTAFLLPACYVETTPAADCTLEKAMAADPNSVAKLEELNRAELVDFNSELEDEKEHLAQLTDIEPEGLPELPEWPVTISHWKTVATVDPYCSCGLVLTRPREEMRSQDVLVEAPWSLLLWEAAEFFNENRWCGDSGQVRLGSAYEDAISLIGLHFVHEPMGVDRILRDVAESETLLRIVAPWVIEEGAKLLNDDGKKLANKLLYMAWIASYAELEDIDKAVQDDNRYLHCNDLKVEGWFMRRWRAQGNDHIVVLRFYMAQAAKELNREDVEAWLLLNKSEIRISGITDKDYYLEQF